MARPKAPSPETKIVSRTNTSITSKLQQLTSTVYQDWLSPYLETFHLREQERIEKFRSILHAADPNFASLLYFKQGSDNLKIVAHSWQVSSLTIEHKPVIQSHPFGAQLQCDASGYIHQLDFETPEECLNAYSMLRAVSIELPIWVKQFQPDNQWNSITLGRLCSFSPLYRSCLRLLVGDELRIYKHGPRASDMGHIKPMSPELAKALQVAANLPEVD